jgi:hypothetical protein
MSEPVDVSVIVPVDDTPPDLRVFYEEFATPLRAAGLTFEFVFVAYARHREETRVLGELAGRGDRIRLLEVGQSVGETTLVRIAAETCRGRVLVTLPLYRQVKACALPALVKEVDGGADVAVARRWPRTDSRINRLQSLVLHRVIRPLAEGRLHDVACGVRAIRPDVLRELPIYGDYGRFLPLLALREGFRVVEVSAPLHPEAMKARVFGPGVYLRRLIDVIGLLFLLRFTEKPLRFFGLIGSLAALPGALILAVVFVQRLQGQALADRPLLLLGVLLLTLGVQAIALGLVGEMIVHLHAARRRGYRLRSVQPPHSPEDSATR